jgi:hypothetical protein
MRRGGALLVASLLLGGLWGAEPQEIPVADHGAVPDDGRDDTVAVQRALDAAKAVGGPARVIFAAGTYHFSGLAGWGDEDAVPARSSYLTVEAPDRIELIGAVDADGAPLTRWIKANDGRSEQPTLLTLQRGRQVALRGVEVGLEPHYNSAGRIVAITGETVRVSVLPGLPRIDGQPAYLMGLYDLERERVKVHRLSWEGQAALPRWKTVGAATGRDQTIIHAPLSRLGKVGDAVYWSQGGCIRPVIALNAIDGLTVERVRMLGGHGFSLVSYGSRDVTYRDVAVVPPPGAIASSVRDGLKLNGLGGTVLMERVRIENCFGDDGMNLHGTWSSTVERVGARALRLESGTPRHPRTPPVGSAVRLLNADFVPVWEGNFLATSDDGPCPVWTFDRDLPAVIAPKQAVEPQYCLPTSVHFKDCVYRNTGRFGVVMKGSKVLIEGCTFTGNRSGIDIGGEWSWGKWLESGSPQDIEIRDCIFDTNRVRWYPPMKGQPRRDDAPEYGSGISVETSTGVVRNLRIHGNRFLGEKTAIDLTRCDGVWIWDNTFTRCDIDVRSDAATVHNLHRRAPPAGDR